MQRKYYKTLTKTIHIFRDLTYLFQLAILPKIARLLLIVALALAEIAGMLKYYNRSSGIAAGANINADPKITSLAIVISLGMFPPLHAATAKRVSVLVHVVEDFLSFGETELTTTILAGHYSRDCDQPKDWSKVQCRKCGESE